MVEIWSVCIVMNTELVKMTLHEMCTNGTQDTTHTKYRQNGMCSCISKHAIHCSEGHLLVLISPARVDSSMLCKASTRVAQFTGCLPLPVSHSLRIPMFICVHRIVQTFVCHNLDSWSISVLQEGNAKTDILGCYFYRNADHPSISTCELQQFW